MQIDPKHLHILSAIIDEGGLSQGAQSLGKSQPSLSRIVADLEARLGEPLFEKGKRPLQPTELCAHLANEGRTMLIVTHDMKLAHDVSDHVVFLHQGLIAEQGPPDTLFGAPKTERLRGFLSATHAA